MGGTSLNIGKDTILISQSQQQSLFTSNQEEGGTRIAINCSESSKPVLVKVKDTDILILMVYAFGAYNGSTSVTREKQIESQKQI